MLVGQGPVRVHGVSMLCPPVAPSPAERLAKGRDSCGAHWMTPEQFPGKVKSPFWGGTFFWATAKFLLSLPPLPPPTWKNRFEAENWIGRGPSRPSVTDYHNGWPSMDCK